MLQTTLTERLLEIGHATEAGVANTKNDDAYLIFPAFYLTDIQASKPIPVHVAIVADGEGEHGTGGVASQLAVEKMYSVITESQTTPIPERIFDAIERANSDIYKTAQDDSTLHGMRSTTVAAAVVDSEAYFAHVGDCQAYVLRDGTLWRLTRNQKSSRSSVGEKGAATAAGASSGDALGENSTVAIDQIIVAPPELAGDKGAVGVRVNRSWLPLQPKDTILLCSKGLTNFLEADTIQQVLSVYPPQEAANHLVGNVIDNGGSDNLTVVVMRWNGEVVTGGATGFPVSRSIGFLIGTLMALLAVVVWWILSSSTTVPAVDPVANTPEPPAASVATATETVNTSIALVATTALSQTVVQTATVTLEATNTAVVTATGAPIAVAPPTVTAPVSDTGSTVPLESIAIVPTANAQPTSDGNLFITIEPPTAVAGSPQGTPEPTNADSGTGEVSEAPQVDLTATASAEIGSVRNAVAATLTALPTRTATQSATDTPRPTSTATNTVAPTPRPTSTATPDVAATETGQAALLASSLAATLTALPTATSTPQPTATATPHLEATETADAARLATSIAATLEAQPTSTSTNTATPLPTDTLAPTATSTPPPTATPNVVATETAEAERLAASIAATLTAQPTATPTSTNTAAPTATNTAAPTNTARPTATADLGATATAESARLATSIAATVAAQPTVTSTPTPNLNATATAEARRLALSIAATLTAQPTATATNAPTSTPRPSATATPNIGATRTVEVRQLATSIAATLTARPTLTPSRTPRPTSTPTSAATPTLAATATPDVTATPTTFVPPSGSVQLISPVEGSTVDSAMRFEWQASFTPDAGRGFELILWKEGEDPIRSGFGLAAPTTNTNVLADLPSLDSRLGDLLEPGDYRWGILLVQTEPYQRLQYLGQGYALRYARPGGGSGGGSSSGGVSSGE